MTREQILEAVRQHLTGLAYEIEIVPEGARQDGEWWYVPVRARSEPKRQWRYYELLTDGEDEIAEDTQEKVLLVPA